MSLVGGTAGAAAAAGGRRAQVGRHLGARRAGQQFQLLVALVVHVMGGHIHRRRQLEQRRPLVVCGGQWLLVGLGRNKWRKLARLHRRLHLLLMLLLAAQDGADLVAVHHRDEPVDVHRSGQVNGSLVLAPQVEANLLEVGQPQPAGLEAARARQAMAAAPNLHVLGDGLLEWLRFIIGVLLVFCCCC